MSNKKSSPLVPSLRFPEFREAGEWVGKSLGEIISLEYGSPLPEKKRNGGLIPVVGSNGIVGYHDNALVNAPAIVVGRKGSAGQINWIASDCYPIDTTFYVKNKDSQNYLMFFLKLTLEKSKLDDFKDNGAVPGINRNEIYSIKITLPSLPEQQKIAACLSSLDELITAHSQKLDALKKHKKGLMQQLFPAEGQTVPSLRFPEFREAGEWKKIKLGQLGELVSGLTYSPNDVRNDGLLVLRSSNIQNGMIVLNDNVYVTQDIKKVNLSKPNDILICVRNGSKTLIGKNALIPEGMPLCTHGAFMTVFRTESAKFIFQLFQTESYEKQVSADLGATINSINGKQLKKYEFYIPSLPEQQKIAACLSSLDELITAQSQKLDALKKHKKGLMQQLFPVVEL